MRLFHFSDDPTIEVFRPRPVRIPSKRPAGQDWLNGPLAWAIDEWHQAMYLFPRDCPRVLIWAKENTTTEDRAKYFGGSPDRIVAFIERRWLDALGATELHRYEFSAGQFEDIGDAGMWVSRTDAWPIGTERITDLPNALKKADVDLRVMDSLAPLKELWSTTLHTSGIRLRNAADWLTQ